MRDFITLTDINNGVPCYIDPEAILAIRPTCGPIEKIGSHVLLKYGHTLRVLEVPDVVEAVRSGRDSHRPELRRNHRSLERLKE
jgi:hypothetical protein